MFLRITPLALIAGIAALGAALAIGAGDPLAATGPVAPADPAAVPEIRPWIDTVTTSVHPSGASSGVDRPCLDTAHASWVATPILAAVNCTGFSPTGRTPAPPRGRSVDRSRDGDMADLLPGARPSIASPRYRGGEPTANVDGDVISESTDDGDVDVPPTDDTDVPVDPRADPPIPKPKCCRAGLMMAIEAGCVMAIVSDAGGEQPGDGHQGCA